MAIAVNNKNLLHNLTNNASMLPTCCSFRLIFNTASGIILKGLNRLFIRGSAIVIKDTMAGENCRDMQLICFDSAKLQHCIHKVQRKDMMHRMILPHSTAMTELRQAVLRMQTYLRTPQSPVPCPWMQLNALFPMLSRCTWQGSPGAL